MKQFEIKLTLVSQNKSKPIPKTKLILVSQDKCKTILETKLILVSQNKCKTIPEAKLIFVSQNKCKNDIIRIKTKFFKTDSQVYAKTLLLIIVYLKPKYRCLKMLWCSEVIRYFKFHVHNTKI